MYSIYVSKAVTSLPTILNLENLVDTIGTASRGIATAELYYHIARRHTNVPCTNTGGKGVQEIDKSDIRNK